MTRVQFSYTHHPRGEEPCDSHGAAEIANIDELLTKHIPREAYNIKLEFEYDTTSEHLANRYPLSMFMIPKSLLQHGHYYAGKCRNTNIARWDANKGKFFHWRHKFGREFIEDIDYFTPSGKFDEFIPLFELGETPPGSIPIDAIPKI